MSSITLFKKAVTLTNLLSLLVGIILIGIGSYTFNSTGFSQSLSVSLFTLGGFITLVSFCGCWGSENEHLGLLRFYVVVLIGLVVLQIAIGVAAFKYRNDMDDFLDDAWDHAYHKDSKLIHNVEQYFQCCGFASSMDRAVPTNCSVEYGYVSSCRENLRSSFIDSYQTIGIVGAVLGGLELIGLLCALMLTALMDRDSEDETHQALLTEARQLDHEIGQRYDRGKAQMSSVRRYV